MGVGSGIGVLVRVKVTGNVISKVKGVRVVSGVVGSAELVSVGS